MASKTMIIATVAALLGIIAGMASMLQQVPVELRTGSIWILIISELIFLYTFLRLAAHSE